MNNKVFSTLKWIAIIVLPALSVAVKSIGGDPQIHWQYVDTAVTVINSLGIFLGAILGGTNAHYYMKQNQSPDDSNTKDTLKS